MKDRIVIESDVLGPSNKLREPAVGGTILVTSPFNAINIINQIVPVRNITNVPIVITGLKEGFSGVLEVKAGSIHLEGDDHDVVWEFEAPTDFLRVDCSGIDEPGIYILKIITGAVTDLKFRIEPMEANIQISVAEDEET